MRSRLAGAVVVLSLAALLQPLPATAQEDTGGKGKAYPDGHGGEVFFPIGDASFADEVVSFAPGQPDGGDASSDAGRALGIPDYSDSADDEGFLTLGCGGELVVRFRDNKLIDVAGPDLYVFEIGPDVEATAMAVSQDGDSWTRVGQISGGKAEVDIGPYVAAGAAFRFVKLVDLRQACDSGTPGADIDAIGALGSAARIALDSSVLFDSGEHSLKPGGKEELDRVLKEIANPSESRIEVAGHTDSVGSAEANRTLSEKRARTVADYFVANAGFGKDAVTTRAFGESRPVASNDTETGRARNRRVELTVRTTPEAKKQGAPQSEILGIWYSESGGIIELAQQGDRVTGHYRSSEGALVGELVAPDRFEGFWIKDSSRKSCDTDKQGSDHWGGMRLEFDSADRDTFTGYWRYCDEKEDRGAWSEAKRLL